MMGKMDSMLLRAKYGFLNKLNKWKKEEKGASDIVAILVVIVIIIAVAAIFREQLTNAVEAAFKKLTDFIDQ